MNTIRNNNAAREARKEQILRELDSESDRGCILVAASALDHFLEELLRETFVADTHSVKHAVVPLLEGMGPLATFSAKIKLAHGLGLIDKMIFTDLERIRRIRNIASHGYSSMTFETPKIIEISRTLDCADLAVQHLSAAEKSATPKPAGGTSKPGKKVSMERLRFTVTVAWIAGTLEVAGKVADSERKLAALKTLKL